MSRKLILLVDDDLDTVEAYAVLFQALGHATAAATDGPAGLAAALQLRPDLILLDIGLPQITGLEVLRRIRSDEAGARIPVIILTGSTLPNEVDEARRHGCHVVLTKPCEPVALCQAVEAGLHTRVPLPVAEAARRRSNDIRVRPLKPGRSAARPRSADESVGRSLEGLFLQADFLARHSETLRDEAAGLQATARTLQAWSQRLKSARA